MKSSLPHVVVSLIVLSVFALVSPAAAVDLTSNGFRITGAGVPTGILVKYERAYARTFSECRLVIFQDRTIDGFDRFIEGRTDLLVSSRKMTDAERAAAVNNGIVCQEKGLGNICIAVITNAANPVNVLTQDQIADIFTGRITNWKQIGGLDEAIKVVAASDEGPGSGPAFRRSVLKGAPYVVGYQKVASAVKAVDICSKTSNAIGYILAVDPEFVRLPEAGVKFVGLTLGPDSPVYFPHPDLIGKSAYPLVTPLYLVWTPGTVDPCVRSFAAFFEEVCGSPNRTALLSH